MAREIVSDLKTRLLRRIAAAHVAGGHLTDALRVARMVAARGWGCTICPWENAPDTPAAMGMRYRQTIKAIAQQNIDGVLSVKPPALKFDYQILKEILSVAMHHEMKVQFDAQGPETAPQSFRLLEKAAADYRNIGCTLPSRWLRSKRDAERATQLRIAVRVVKGMWSDPEAEDIDPRLAFLELIDILAHGAQHVSVATHDAVLAGEALQRLGEAGIPAELELLAGLPLGVAQIAERRNMPVRVYIPFGTPYLPYNVSHIAHRPAMAGWLLRDICVGRHKSLFRSSGEILHAGE